MSPIHQGARGLYSLLSEAPPVDDLGPLPHRKPRQVNKTELIGQASNVEEASVKDIEKATPQTSKDSFPQNVFPMLPSQPHRHELQELKSHTAMDVPKKQFIPLSISPSPPILHTKNLTLTPPNLPMLP
jgi:hypothetical protein